MEQPVGLDASTFRHIRNTAGRLASAGSVPGMDREDIEQDLILDLWQRRRAFDPSRASFRTFADRIVAHRIATLTCATARTQAERTIAWLDAPTGDDGGPGLADVLADTTAPTDIDLGLAFDVRRFVATLTQALRRCCAILAEPNVAEAARVVGLHRSVVYEGVTRLRVLATAAGLRDYLNSSRQPERPCGK